LQEKSFSRISGLCLIFLAIYFLISILVSVFQLSPAFFAPRGILFKSYSWASFFLPLYLFIAGFANYRQKYRRENFFLLNISVIPVLTGLIFFQSLLGLEGAKLTESLIYAFGKTGTMLLSLAVLLFEIILISRIFFFMRNPEKEGSDVEQVNTKRDFPEPDLYEKEGTVSKSDVKIYQVSSDGPSIYYPEELLDETETEDSSDDFTFEPELMGPVGDDFAETGNGFEIKEPELPEPEEPDEDVFEDYAIESDPGIDMLSDDDIAYLDHDKKMDENETLKEFKNKLVESKTESNVLHLSRKNNKLQIVTKSDIKPLEIIEEEKATEEYLSHDVFDEIDEQFDLDEKVKEFDEKENSQVEDEPRILDDTDSGALPLITEDSINTDNEYDLSDEEFSEDESIEDSSFDEPGREVSTGITIEEPENIEELVVEENDSAEFAVEDVPVSEKLPAISSEIKSSNWNGYKIPIEGLLNTYPDQSYSVIDEQTNKAAGILKRTLSEFNIEAEVTGIRKGPVITMFEILPAAGVKLSKIVNLADNIALGLAASSVRIVAPIPGKHAVGIEVPNKKRSVVAFGDILTKMEGKQIVDKSIPFVLGKNVNGDNLVIDLARTPHLLIAGSTGSGKSVCVNTLICSLLYERSPQDVKLILIDPKIVELKLYNGIPHLLTPVITEPKRAFQAVQWALYEMERRYALLDAMGVRDIKTYNKRIKERKIATLPLPFIVLIVDEFADLMATSGKELEAILARLAAMSRAVGIHLVLATQRPSIDVITGLIKANFPSRIAFMVASKTDSRIILDSMGAEKLLGRGDMLFTSAWDPFPTRIQGSFLSEEEVENVVSFVKTLGEPDYIDDEIFIDDDEENETASGSMNAASDDPLYGKALDIVLTAGKASASYIQRRLSIGYNRAARLVEEMEQRGIVGPPNGSKPREIIHFPDRVLDKEEFNTDNIEEIAKL